MFCGRQKLLIPSLLTDNILQMGGYFTDCRRQLAVRIFFRLQAAVCRSLLQKQYIRFALIKIAGRRIAAIHNAYKIFYGGLYD